MDHTCRAPVYIATIENRLESSTAISRLSRITIEVGSDTRTVVEVKLSVKGARFTNILRQS